MGVLIGIGVMMTAVGTAVFMYGAGVCLCRMVEVFLECYLEGEYENCHRITFDFRSNIKNNEKWKL